MGKHTHDGTLERLGIERRGVDTKDMCAGGIQVGDTQGCLPELSLLILLPSGRSFLYILIFSLSEFFIRDIGLGAVRWRTSSMLL